MIPSENGYAVLCVRFPVHVSLPIFGAKDDVLGIPVSVIYPDDIAGLFLKRVGWEGVKICLLILI